MGVSAGPDIIEDGLTLYINSFDKNSYLGSGTTWADLSGKGYDISLQNGPTYYVSPTSASFTFDGVDDYGYVKTLNYGGGRTISEMSVFAWVRTEYAGGIPAIWDNNNWAILDFDRSEVFTFAVNGTGEIQMNGLSSNAGGFSQYYDLLSYTPVNDGGWHYIGWTFSVSNQEIKMYVDGELDRTFTANGSMTALGNGLQRYGVIGDGSEMSTENGTRNNLYYQGEISSIMFYDNKVLTLEEIQQNYNTTRKNISQLNLVPLDPIPGATSNYAFLLDAQNNRSLKQTINNTWYDIGGETLDNNAIMTNVTKDYINKKWDFNGSNSYGTFVEDTLINSGGPYNYKTISIWFNAKNINTTTSQSSQYIFDQGGGANGFSIYTHSGSVYGILYSDYLGWSNSGSEDFLNGTAGFVGSASISENTWYHVFLGMQLTGSNYEFKFYLNGQPTTSKIQSGGGLNANHDPANFGYIYTNNRHHLGLMLNASNYFSGSIAYLKETNTTFTDAAVLTEFNTSKSFYGY